MDELPPDDGHPTTAEQGSGHDGPAHAMAPQPDEPDGADDLPGHPVADEGPRVER